MLTQTAEYALRAIADLAKHHPNARTTQQVATATLVPPDYLSKVLKELARTGLVKSQRGLHGGFSLLRDPNDLSVVEVISAVCPLQRIRECPLGLEEHSERLCPLHRLLDEAMESIECAFSAVTLGELVTMDGAESALCTPSKKTMNSGNKADKKKTGKKKTGK